MFSSTPYIAFPGNAREALEYYREIFGGTLDLMTYDGMPDMGFTPPPGAVAHAQLHGGLVTLAGGLAAVFEVAGAAELPAGHGLHRVVLPWWGCCPL